MSSKWHTAFGSCELSLDEPGEATLFDEDSNVFTRIRVVIRDNKKYLQVDSSSSSVWAAKGHLRLFSMG